MTRTARAMGMTRTTFTNPNGLPDSRQVSTARDMATLGLRIQRDFPQYYKHFSTRSFKYGKRRYGNHNRLLGRVKGVDGIKTGYTRASGLQPAVFTNSWHSESCSGGSWRTHRALAQCLHDQDPETRLAKGITQQQQNCHGCRQAARLQCISSSARMEKQQGEVTNSVRYRFRICRQPR